MLAPIKYDELTAIDIAACPWDHLFSEMTQPGFTDRMKYVKINSDPIFL